MSDKTSIQWTDATWNPLRGCTKVSPGCAHCYAETFAERFRGVKGHPYEHGFDLRLVPEKLTEPMRWKKPRRVFVNSMSDLFQDGVPFPFIAAVFAVMAYCERHTFQVLTKRADRMRAFMEWVNAPAGADVYGQLRFNRVDTRLAQDVCESTADGVCLEACLHNMGIWPPRNIWLGVSVENQHFADERILLLLQTSAAVRFVSAEPLLEAIDLSGPLNGYPEQTSQREYVTRDMAIDAGDRSMEGSLYSGEAWEQTTPVLDWVIVGGESGHGARGFSIEWARSIIAQCRAANVPVFVKQLGASAHETCPLCKGIGTDDRGDAYCARCFGCHRQTVFYSH